MLATRYPEPVAQLSLSGLFVEGRVFSYGMSTSCKDRLTKTCHLRYFMRRCFARNYRFLRRIPTPGSGRDLPAFLMNKRPPATRGGLQENPRPSFRCPTLCTVLGRANRLIRQKRSQRPTVHRQTWRLPSRRRGIATQGLQGPCCRPATKGPGTRLESAGPHGDGP